MSADRGPEHRRPGVRSIRKSPSELRDLRRGQQPKPELGSSSILPPTTAQPGPELNAGGSLGPQEVTQQVSVDKGMDAAAKARELPTQADSSVAGAGRLAEPATGTPIDTPATISPLTAETEAPAAGRPVETDIGGMSADEIMEGNAKSQIAIAVQLQSIRDNNQPAAVFTGVPDMDAATALAKAMEEVNHWVKGATVKGFENGRAVIEVELLPASGPESSGEANAGAVAAPVKKEGAASVTDTERVANPLPQVFIDLITLRDAVVGPEGIITPQGLLVMAGGGDVNKIISGMTDRINSEGATGPIPPEVGEFFFNMEPSLRAAFMNGLSDKVRPGVQQALGVYTQERKGSEEVITEAATEMSALIGYIRDGRDFSPGLLLNNANLLSSEETLRRPDIVELRTHLRQAILEADPQFRLNLAHYVIIQFEDVTLNLPNQDIIREIATELTNANRFLALGDFMSGNARIRGSFPELTGHFDKLVMLARTGRPDSQTFALFNSAHLQTVYDAIYNRLSGVENADLDDGESGEAEEEDSIDRLGRVLGEHNELSGRDRTRHRAEIIKAIRGAKVSPEKADLIFENIGSEDDDEHDAVIREFYNYIKKSRDRRDPWIISWRQDPDYQAYLKEPQPGAVGGVLGAVEGLARKIVGLDKRTSSIARTTAGQLDTETDEPDTMPGAAGLDDESGEVTRAAGQLTPEQLDLVLRGITNEIRALDGAGVDSNILDEIFGAGRYLIGEIPATEAVLASKRDIFTGPFIDLIYAQDKQGNEDNVRTLLRIADQLQLAQRIPEMATELKEMKEDYSIES